MDCPSCYEPLSEQFFRRNVLYTLVQLDILRKHFGFEGVMACNRCGGKIMDAAGARVTELKEEYQGQVTALLDAIQVTTIPSPAGWHYQVRGLVLGQATLGTGFITELSGTLADMLGRRSGRYESKVEQGQNSCMAQLRMKALELGADAITGVAVGYTEVGGDKGLVMVTMSGTAVRIESNSAAAPEQAERLEQLRTAQARWVALSTM